MPESEGGQELKSQLEEAGEGLRQALIRLTGLRQVAVIDQLKDLRRQMDSLAALQTSLASLQNRLDRKDAEIEQHILAMRGSIQDISSSLVVLEKSLVSSENALKDEFRASLTRLDTSLVDLQAELNASEAVANRIRPVMVPVIHENARIRRGDFAEAVAPVIGPAIRHQIRDARQDMIDALHPVIGEIIAKAISESMRELTRKIDAQLRRQLDFGARLKLLLARLRGVSEAELLLRESLPFTVDHLFLIHRRTGLLLQHIPLADQDSQDGDLISGMMTAIGDFVRESFGPGELEEVTHGDRRIMLEGGQYAYLAVVLEGVEPGGYSHLLRNVIQEIHLRFEEQLRDYDGDESHLPDFSPWLKTLIAPGSELLGLDPSSEAMSQGQKWTLAASLLGILLLLAVLILGCLFTVRLWPLVFPG